MVYKQIAMTKKMKKNTAMKEENTSNDKKMKMNGKEYSDKFGDKIQIKY
jgi:hypothetical protein